MNVCLCVNVCVCVCCVNVGVCVCLCGGTSRTSNWISFKQNASLDKVNRCVCFHTLHMVL